MMTRKMCLRTRSDETGFTGQENERWKIKNDS
jgi:hypothetical protein